MTVPRSDELAHLVASISDYAIYMLDPKGTVISWNAGAERFKGYVAEEIIGSHFSTFYTLEDREAGLPARALHTALAEGKFEAEGWRVRKGGTRFWANVVIDPIYDDHGKLLGFAKITRDVSDKKRAADALLASERQFRMLVEGVLDYAIYMLSPAGIVTNWNAGARRIKGYLSHEIVGDHFSRFYTEEDRLTSLPDRALQEAEIKGKYEAEGWRVRKDGTRFWAHVVIDAIRDDENRLVGFAKITRDITEKKHAEDALQNVRLQLFQSQKLEAIGQLTGGVAHDFNNLLSIISSAVEVLNVQSSSNLERHMLESIQRAVARGAAMTQQLLSFARQQPLAPAVCDLNAIIGAFEPVLRRGVTPAIRFKLHLAQQALNIVIDEARLEAAVLNLVVNARDAMPDGGALEIATEIVRLEQAEADGLAAGKYARLTVSDTGTGMSPEIVSKVFEPFFTTKPVGKGTGLGLSQVQGFILQSGGRIEIQSQVGQGTTVSILLPTLDGEAVEKGPRADVEKVLIVEDESELGDLAASLFQTLGYECLVAHDGEQALEMLRVYPNIDVLFSDVVMPKMTGIELAKAARAEFPQLKIILVSGYPTTALREQGAIGEFDIVSKPYRLSEIVRRLR